MKKISILFPGQNLQNLQKNLYLNIKRNIFNKTLEEASQFLNYNLLKNLKYNLPLKTKYLPYVIISISVALYREWTKNISFIPHIMAGHSLGHYSALICSNILSFKNALIILKKRNQIIKNSLKNISTLMYIIIGEKLSVIKKICQKVSQDYQKVSIACINSKTQIVISGQKIAVLKVIKFFKKKNKIYVIPLPIFLCLHCSLLKKDSKKFFTFLKHFFFQTSKINVLCSTKTKILTSSKEIKKSLYQQLYKPVLWKNTLKFIKKKNINIFIEMGFGNTLTKINFYNKIQHTYSTDPLKNFFKTMKIIKNIK
ncbi:acyltransferase domain-containing protein [Buchnera aphidicola]|uniref:Malonyl CoA-acyl carrier protein transacylase n=1 Tax=Buchnera aphidicola subsp. Tuberolachnus salignus TaxID=98804 RepID=A0A160SW08_BUCTT|nr:acyltransferase domain-containing protein [Buchnera aphidicola]CUR53207.1 Malonyl CoA-acyl carrier protein transacylase [Buchnera aphidicola (Tuberolachnus salignus)]